MDSIARMEPGCDDGFYHQVREDFAAAGTPDEAFACFRRLMGPYGLKYSCAISHCGLRDNGLYRRVFQTDYPLEWQRRYGLEGYGLTDPVVVRMSDSFGAFAFNGTDGFGPLDPVGVRILGEAAEFGLTRGLVVPCWAAGQGLSSVTCIFEKHLPRLAEQVVIEFIARSYFSRLVEFTRTARPVFSMAGVNLSPRQRACLDLLSRGYELEDLSRKLGMEVTTARTHIRRAMTCLGVNNRTHAIARALRLGLIGTAGN